VFDGWARAGAEKESASAIVNETARNLIAATPQRNRNPGTSHRNFQFRYCPNSVVAAHVLPK
jgi:hypothetical protein